ncbi:hypothetical protein [Hydrogenivirga sp.]
MHKAREVLGELSMDFSIQALETGDVKSALDLNYKVRKAAENLMTVLGDREECLSKAVDIYMRLGDNYRLFDVNPSLAINTLKEAVEELRELLSRIDRSS